MSVRDLRVVGSRARRGRPGRRQQSRAQQVRDLLAHMGLASTEQLAHEVLARGIFTPEQLESCRLRGVKEFCRRAVTRPVGADNVPYAGLVPERDDSGKELWKPLDLMSYDEASYDIQRRVRILKACHEILVALQERCVRAFGRAPRVPRLVHDRRESRREEIAR